MISLRNNQKDALHNFKEHYYVNKEKMGVLSMCCGSGKTRTFYEMMKICFEQNKNVCLYATSRILLVESVIQEILEYLYIEAINNCEKIQIFNPVNICIIVKVSSFNVVKVIDNIYKKIQYIPGFISNHFTKFFTNFTNKNSYTNEYLQFISLSTTDIPLSYTVNDKLIKNKKVLVITTYESLVLINKCLKKYETKLDIDLLVCDESHNLVSDNNKQTNIIIDSNISNINSKKIVFMTATPLSIKPTNKQKINTQIYSMENTNIFGKCFYEYSFYEGMRDKYIVDFEILGYTKLCYDKLNNIVDCETMSDDDRQTMYFNVVINQLLATIKQYNLIRTIVYANNTTKVINMCKMLQKHFVYDDNNHPHVRYIISDQSHEIKNINLSWFKNNDLTYKILLSVDIFNEGVDIPICDSILFSEPRQSETCIVQNIGRALRLHSTKKKAYVILPIIISDTDDEPPINSDYENIINICKKLKMPSIKTIYNRPYYGSVNERNHTQFNNTSNEKTLIQENNKTQSLDNDLNDIISSISIVQLDILKFEECKQNEIINEIPQLLLQNYDDFKAHVKNSGCNNIYDLGLFIKECKLIEDKRNPHIIFNEKFISYGDLLIDQTYTYDESVKYIRRLRLNCINSSNDFIVYYLNVITDAFKGKNTCAVNIEEFIKLPYSPKEYYGNVWTNWSEYISENLKENTHVHTAPIKNAPSYTSNSQSNFNRLHINKPSYFSFNMTDLNDILPIVKFVTTYCELGNMEFKGVANMVDNVCVSVDLLCENKLIFKITKNNVNYNPHNITNPTLLQTNKTRNFPIKGINIEDMLTNIKYCMECNNTLISYWSDDCYGSCLECCCINCDKQQCICTHNDELLNKLSNHQ